MTSTDAPRGIVAETLATFQRIAPRGTPLTASEVADELGCTRRTAYNRLEKLVERGDVKTKKVGARGRVWWLPRQIAGAASDADDDALFDSFVDAAETAAIYTVDLDGFVQSWNEGARDVTGYEREAVLGQHVSTFYTDEDVAADVPSRHLANAADGDVEDEGWRLRADGSRFWASVTTTPVYDGEQLTRYVRVVRDVAARRNYEQRLRAECDLLTQILETSPTGIAVFDTDGSVLQANDEAAKFLEVSPEQFDEYTLGDRDLYGADGEPLPVEERPGRRVLESGEPVFDQRIRVQAVDGDWRWLSVNATPLDCEADVPDGVVITFSDTTLLTEKTKQVERRRNELQRELDDVFERIDDAVIGVDTEWRISHVNERAETLFDRSGAELVGTSIWETFPASTDSTVRTSFETALVEQQTASFEEHFPSLDAWFDVRAYPSETGLSVYLRDVTARKEREQVLEQYETIVQTVEDGIYVLDENYHFTRVNDAYVEMTGYSRDELLGSHCSLVVGDGVSSTAADLSEALVTASEEHAALEAEIQRADGSGLVAESRFTPLPTTDGEFRGTVGVVRDTSDRKKRERELEQYETIVETADDGVYVLDENDCFQLVNDAYCELVGYDREELLGEPSSLVHKHSVNERANALAEMVRNGERDFAAMEVELTTKGGEQVLVESRFSPYPLEDSIGRAGIVRDLSERIERQRELEQYEAIVESADDGIIVLDGESRFQLVNDAYCELVGYDRGELLGEPITSITSEEANEEAKRLAEAVAAGERDFAAMEVELTTKGGEQVLVESRFSPYPLEDSIGRAGIVRDLTARVERERELQARVRQQAATTELGRLALEEADPDALMDSVVDIVAEVLDVPFCSVVEWRPETDDLLVRAGVGWEDGTVGTTSVETGRGSLAGYTLRTDAPVTVEDAETETRYRQSDLLAAHDVVSSVAVVVGPSDDPWGVLCAHASEHQEFDSNDVNFVQTAANVLVSAIDRIEYERQLKHQRERLGALNDLNTVIRGINDAVIEQSTREEIEAVVCERLAAVDSYQFAWVVGVDARTQTTTLRAEAGVEGYYEKVPLSIDPGKPGGQGPTAKAIRTKEMQVVHDVFTDPVFEPWTEYAREYGYRSMVSIPVVHEGVLYGVISVYADRAAAFAEEEQAVIGQLGETIGHAIASVDRKQALMSDELVELELVVRDLFTPHFQENALTGTISMEQVVPVGGDTFLEYGTASEEDVEVLETLVDRLPFWERVTVLERSAEEVRFELELTKPPLNSVIASHGGHPQSAVIDEGDFRVTVHLPPSVGVRDFMSQIQDVYPAVSSVAQRQVTRTRTTTKQIKRTAMDEMTERQQTALVVAFYSGHFEWPRESSGEELAESLGVSAPTYHQHLRAAERKLLEAVFAVTEENE
ncbi:MAG: PAS domain S-box protein [Halobacteriota archaeon]